MPKKKNFYLTTDQDLEKRAYQYMKYIHADPSLCGYKYTIYAIVMIIQNDTLDYTGTNGVYAKIAERFGANSWGCVERGIRHLIEKLYDTLPQSQYVELFDTNKKMTNSYLIHHACNFIRYEAEKLA